MAAARKGSQVITHMAIGFAIAYAFTGSVALGGLAVIIEPVLNVLLLPFHASFAEATIDMVIAGLGSGALVAALPASAAAAAPKGQTGVATGLTNMTKTIGGAIASAVFALILFHGGAETEGTASSLSAYLLVWGICGGAAIVSALLLFVVPKAAFSDRPAEEA